MFHVRGEIQTLEELRRDEVSLSGTLQPHVVFVGNHRPDYFDSLIHCGLTNCHDALPYCTPVLRSGLCHEEPIAEPLEADWIRAEAGCTLTDTEARVCVSDGCRNPRQPDYDLAVAHR